MSSAARSSPGTRTGARSSSGSSPATGPEERAAAGRELRRQPRDASATRRLPRAHRPRLGRPLVPAARRQGTRVPDPGADPRRPQPRPRLGNRDLRAGRPDRDRPGRADRDRHRQHHRPPPAVTRALLHRPAPGHDPDCAARHGDQREQAARCRGAADLLDQQAPGNATTGPQVPRDHTGARLPHAGNDFSLRHGPVRRTPRTGRLGRRRWSGSQWWR